MYTLMCDGGCKGNPGTMYGSYMILDNPNLDSAAILYHETFKGPPIGRQTNNIAEYTSLIKGLEFLSGKIKSPNKITVIMDSTLVLKQVGGSWKVNKPHLRPLWDRARELLSEFEETVLKWVPRNIIEGYLGH